MSVPFKIHEPRSLARLVEVVLMATVPLRTGPSKEVRQEGDVRVEEVMDFPTVAQGIEHGITKTYDMLIFQVGIMPIADEVKADFIEALRAYPDMGRLAGGPSYIELGAVLSEYDDQAQQVAIQMIALGDYYDVWKAVTPVTLGMAREGAAKMVRSGFIMPVGLKFPAPESAPA